MTKRALISHLSVVSAASLSLTSGFAPSGIVTNRPLSSKNSHHARITPPLSSVASEGEVTDADIVALSTNPTLNLTPEGYGFSSPISRVMQNSGTGTSGYYRAKSSESVVDVMENIGKTEVALVFSDEDDKELMGIFTDYDFIRLSTELARYARTEEESATFMAAPVSSFMTPAEKLICVEPTDTASQAVAIMTTNNIRHTVIVDKCGPNFSYLPGSSVSGVISMQGLLQVIQSDNRLSFDKLSQKFPGLANKPIEQMREELKSKANALANNDETAKKDLIRAVTAIISAGSVALFASQSSWLSDHAELAMIAIFVLGYIGIIFEEVFEFNKAAVALLMSTGLWVTYADFYGGSTGLASDSVLDQLKDQLAEVSDICFFLLAASAIVEVVDAHQGFKVVTNLITTKSKKGLFWVIGFLTFFLSAILNNLTVTIVMVSLLRKLVPNDDDRRLFGAMVVVAANAGGVWTPIGDVTTTMLWINNQLSTIPTVTELFLPSVVCLVASLFFLVNQVEEDSSLAESTLPPPSPLAPRGQLVFWTGIASLLSVPVFAELTGLPPYLAMVSIMFAVLC
jgi:CBS domain-containing protein